IKAFQDPNEDVCQAATEAVANYGKDAVAPLVAALKSDKTGTRLHASRSLGLIGSDAKNALPGLPDLLHDSDEAVLVEACNTLSKFGKEAIPVLTAAVKDNDPKVRQHAIEGLGKIGVDAAGDLVDLLKDKRVDVRRAAAQALIPLNVSDKLVVLSLGEALKDEDETVRFSSVQALVSLRNGAKLAAPALVKALSDQSPNVREYAFYCLQNMGEDAVPALKENLKSKDVKTRINTASLMLRLGIDPQAQEAAVEVLRAGLKEKDDTVKQQAAVA